LNERLKWQTLKIVNDTLGNKYAEVFRYSITVMNGKNYRDKNKKMVLMLDFT
jgi:hypothetical protein